MAVIIDVKEAKATDKIDNSPENKILDKQVSIHKPNGNQKGLKIVKKVKRCLENAVEIESKIGFKS